VAAAHELPIVAVGVADVRVRKCRRRHRRGCGDSAPGWAGLRAHARAGGGGGGGGDGAPVRGGARAADAPVSAGADACGRQWCCGGDT
jgi:hypothetical protein